MKVMANTSNTSRRCMSRYRGSAMLETTIVMVFVLMPLMLGMMEFSYFFFAKHSVQGAAREGARTAIMPGATTSGVNTAIRRAMEGAGLEDSGYSVTVSPAITSSPGQQIKVTVECPWTTIWTVPAGPWSPRPSGGKVTGVTVMQKEG